MIFNYFLGNKTPLVFTTCVQLEQQLVLYQIETQVRQLKMFSGSSGDNLSLNSLYFILFFQFPFISFYIHFD